MKDKSSTCLGLRNPNRRFVLGIDPGKSGAIAVLDASSRSLVLVQDLPLTWRTLADGRTKRSSLDAYTLGMLIDSHASETLLAVVEEVSAMTYVNRAGELRGQGAAASFAFGQVYGEIIGCLSTCLIPTLYTRPAVWKSLMNLSRDKDESRRKAMHLFPAFSPSFSRKKDDGRAEAALLAWFGATHLITKDVKQAEKGAK